MVKINFLNLLVLCFLAFGLLSCGDDDEGLPFEVAPVGQMIMNYNGTDWESTNVTGINSTAVSSITAEGGLNLVFMVLQNTDTGTYPIGAANLNSLSVRSLNSTTENYSTSNEANASGEIIISAKDADNQTISGSFNAVVINDAGESRTVSNGFFNKMPYSQ